MYKQIYGGHAKVIENNNAVYVWKKKHRKFLFLYIPKRHFLNFVALTIWLIIAVCKNYSAWKNNM